MSAMCCSLSHENSLGNDQICHTVILIFLLGKISKNHLKIDLKSKSLATK